MKNVFNIILILLLFIGCGISIKQTNLFWELNDDLKTTSIKTCQNWIAKNLDLGSSKLAEYHFDLDGFTDRNGKKFIFAQFAHKVRMKDIIYEEIGQIEAISGGFPDYFTIDLSADGKKVIGHYAENE